MSENMILAELGPFSVTAYGLVIILGLLAAAGCVLLIRKNGIPAEKRLTACIAAVIGGLLGARLLYCATMLETILADYEEGAAFIPQLWLGGYTLYGGVLGGLLAVWLTCRKTGMTGATADLLSPAAALFLMFARLGERFTSQGLGAYVDDEALWFFPVAVMDQYEQWRVPVFLYEAAAALAIFIVCLVMLKKNGHPGETAEAFLILLSLSQIILDSLREDEYIRFGFVHLNMLAAGIVLLAVLLFRLGRSVTKKWKIWRVILFLAGIGACVGIEFALDKSTVNNVLLYTVMAVILVLLGFPFFRGNRTQPAGE